MEPDKRKHVLLCLVATLGLAVLILLAPVIGTPAAAAIGGCLLAGAYEMVQKYRGDGVASWADFWHGVGGSVAAGVALQLLGL